MGEMGELTKGELKEDEKDEHDPEGLTYEGIGVSTRRI